MDEVLVDPGIYPNLDNIVDQDEPTILLPCVICNKTFKPEVLQRHSKVCEKNTCKKRKTFDSFKQRVKGTELAEFLPYSALQKRAPGCEKPPSPKKTSQWKEKHEAFVTAIRAARGDATSDGGGSGEPRSLLRAPDHERCPYCERHFGPKAFDRHQEWCREQHSRHPPSVASLQAKERLEARIKYRAPPIRSKRALAREKYSPVVQRKVRQTSPASMTESNSSTCTSAGSSISRHALATAVQHQDSSKKLSRSGNSFAGRSQNRDTSTPVLSRSAFGRTSLRSSQRQPHVVSADKRLTGSLKSTSVHSNADLPKNCPDNELKEDLMVSSLHGKHTLLKSQRSRKLKAVGNTKSSNQINVSSELASKVKTEPEFQNIDCVKRENWKNNKNPSKNPKTDQVWSGSPLEEPYDPYASAERQMLELLHSDSASDINIGKQLSTNQKLPSPSPSISPAASFKTVPLETSPTSAFTRYSKEYDASRCISQTADQTEDTSSTFHNDQQKADESIPLEVLPELPQSITTHLSAPGSPEEQPQPPPRSYKRSASLQASKGQTGTVISDKQLQTDLKSYHSVDGALEDSDYNLDNRPGTYDIEKGTHFRKGNCEENGWLNNNEVEGHLDDNLDTPVLKENANGGKSEVLQIDERYKNRNETRESREIRELTEQEGSVSGIDSLLEEVARMQHSVTMLSDLDTPNKLTSVSPSPQSSARSRRNRTGKMHIEDFLFPAEILEQANENLRSSLDPMGCSSSVFGSTKSRRTLSKSRKLLEHMLFPTSDLDINANTDLSTEDGDVVVSPNACIDSNVFPQRPSSPVTLTSKVIDDGDDDGLPRPKPVSLSPHSSGAQALTEPTSPTQSHTRSRQSTGSRFSADSAYSSLNRRSPVIRASRRAPTMTQQEQRHAHGNESPSSVLSQSFAQSLALSSSGSESSLPPLTGIQSSKQARSKPDRDTPSSDIMSATTPLLPKLSKFCYECGTKFSVSLAKFCCECGARRLELS